jgi:hypothetical protein
MRVLVIPDLHCPYQHRNALAFVSAVADAIQPDAVVHLGDEIDAAAFSRYAKNPDLDSPAAEIKRARRALQPWFDLFPIVRVCNSNHTQRPLKRAAEAGLPNDFVRTIREVLGAPPGWTWADEHEIDGVIYFHGEGFSGPAGARNAAVTYRQSVCIGHLHGHAGISWIAGPRGTIFGMNAGCLINPRSAAFSYAKHSKHKPTLGCSVILDGVPSFVPLL